MAIRRMRFACWITKATNTHSKYVILIDFPLQQWLHERTLLLRCTYIAGLVAYRPINPLNTGLGALYGPVIMHVPLVSLH